MTFYLKMLAKVVVYTIIAITSSDEYKQFEEFLGL